MRHCLAHMREDFPGCVGLVTSLRGNILDGAKITLAGWVHRWRFNDETRYGLATAAALSVCAYAGAQVLRVHDVAQAVKILSVVDGVRRI